MRVLRRTRRAPLILLQEGAVEGQIRRALGDQYDVQVSAGWADLADRVGSAALSLIAVVDPYFGRGRARGVAPELLALLTRFPSVAIVAALHSRPGWLEDVRELGERGIAAVIDLENDGTKSLIRERISGLHGRALRALVLGDLGPAVSSRGRIILEAAIRVAQSGGTVDQLAGELGVHRVTLRRWCEIAQLPSPGLLLKWIRLLLAAELLDNPGRTVEAVAFSTGYSSAAALRHATLRYLGETPTRLRDQGALKRAGERFAVAVKTRRTEASQ